MNKGLLLFRNEPKIPRIFPTIGKYSEIFDTAKQNVFYLEEEKI